MAAPTAVPSLTVPESQLSEEEDEDEDNDTMVPLSTNNNNNIEQWTLRDTIRGWMPDNRSCRTPTTDPPLPLRPQNNPVSIPLHRAAVVQQAFTAAANVVWRSCLEPTNVVVHPNASATTLSSSGLLVLLDLKTESWQRSFQNKEYTKRKKSLLDKRTFPKRPAVAAAATKTVATKKTTKANKPTKRSTPKEKTVSTTATTSTTPTATTASSTQLLPSRVIVCGTLNRIASFAFPNVSDSLTIPHAPDNLDGDTKRSLESLSNSIQKSMENARLRANLRQAVHLERPFVTLENPFQYLHNNNKKPLCLLSSLDKPPTMQYKYQPNAASQTNAWINLCLPTYQQIAQTGLGHAIVYDRQWKDRHGRLAALLLTKTSGPHLIVTTQPELEQFAREFRSLQDDDDDDNTTATNTLRALLYHGTSQQRQYYRRRYFYSLSDCQKQCCPVQVILCNYQTFLLDYLHLCHVAWDTCLLDDGVGWMGAREHAVLGHLWEHGVWSRDDHGVGLAGTYFSKAWEFLASTVSESAVKEAKIGLSCRRRLLTASTFCVQQRHGMETIPVGSLLEFLLPIFYSAVKEEWDRSKIMSDPDCIQHLTHLVAHSLIVHDPTANDSDMHSLAVSALTGQLEAADRSNDPDVPQQHHDEAFLESSRRGSLTWLGPIQTSWLRYELASSDLQKMTKYLKTSSQAGFVCNEIMTASSTTSSGANGQVAGTMAFRLAVRCGRPFGSESGLRQHIAAHHAPPGTWLCRTCSIDCFTSQARTFHEKLCGQPKQGEKDEIGGAVGVSPKTGQVVTVKKRGPNKKKNRVPAGSPVVVLQKDADGSSPVPTYRGVWVNKDGKHFVKINGERIKKDDNLLLFDSSDAAAKKYDSLVGAENDKPEKVELNFKPDGSRVVYENKASVSPGGLGGGAAASVVPALAVINIKDLPPDVKPLLRDPRQTSRTGGNSKRHIYAYRGVCRQSRKGHDRWQSQISFAGVNHYLGTFDSEWDAAAIYAWAHLILYGEEATRKAQREGEEAAEAYEQEKRDIAAGKIPEPPPKPEKKKKAPAKRKNTDASGEPPKKRRAGRPKSSESSGEKKPRASSTRAPRAPKESLAPVLSKALVKVPQLAPKEAFENMSDADLIDIAAENTKACRDLGYCGSRTMGFGPPDMDDGLRPCIPNKIFSNVPPLCRALLVGLSATQFGWDIQNFVESKELQSEQDTMVGLQLLAVEYDDDGVNEEFFTCLQGTRCTIGAASEMTQRMYRELGMGSVPLGGTVGKLDCHIGGVPGSCSERAALIRYQPSDECNFTISCLSERDVVTVNGTRLEPEMGSLRLMHEDICSVGPRVFVFWENEERST